MGLRGALERRDVLEQITGSKPHLGLGAHSTVEVVVEFLDGSQVTLSNIPVNRKIVIGGSL